MWHRRMVTRRSVRFAVVGRQKGRSLRGAFTMIEILVSVSLVAVLAAVLLPAMGTARQAGRASACMAMLRNGGLAMTMYLDDNDGSFWPYFHDVDGAEGGRRWWFGFEPGGPSANAWQGNRRLDKSSGFLSRYLTGAEKDLVCPSFPYPSRKYFAKFSPSAGGYGYNTGALGGYSWIDPSNVGPRKIQAFTGRTADVFALADGIHFDRLDHSGASPLEQTFNEPPYIQWQDPSLFDRNAGVNGGFGHFRHLNRAMVLYLDSHVAGQPTRRALHPYSVKGTGPVANLSDDSLRTTRVQRGRVELQVDRVYGLP